MLVGHKPTVPVVHPSVVASRGRRRSRSVSAAVVGVDRRRGFVPVPDHHYEARTGDPDTADPDREPARRSQQRLLEGSPQPGQGGDPDDDECRPDIDVVGVVVDHQPSDRDRCHRRTERDEHGDRRHIVAGTQAAIVSVGFSLPAPTVFETRSSDRDVDPRMQLLVHGGAGSDPDDPAVRQNVLEHAADAGVTESTPVDAVETAVAVLESDPRFNAGVGSAVQSDGVIRTDAGIMTDDRSVGAACSMPGVEHAVSVARLVMEETPHGFVSGDHAVALAEAHGIETGVDLWSDRTREQWDDLEPPAADPTAQLEWIRERYGNSDPGGRDADGADEGTSSDPPDHDSGERGPPSSDPTDHDTVGAVAVDGDALAAATSTGGRWLALAGRVGDVPQVGAGFYCSPAAAVSATGAGEDIARVTLSRRVARHVERGCDADEAADLAIEEFAELTGSTAGVIAIDARGTLGSAYNSAAMQTARARRRS